jgi:phosphoglycolate phosphatase
MKYDAIVFDFDGTLASSEEDVWESVAYAAQVLGGRIPQWFRSDSRHLSLSEKEIFEAITPRISSQKLTLFQHELTRHYRQLNTFAYTELYSGMESLLQSLQSRKIPCYIVTMKPLEPLEKILASKGWDQYFVHWISPDSKPGQFSSKGEMIRTLKEMFPAHIDPIYIGDTFSDIQAAKMNGMDSMGVLYGDGDGELLRKEKPDYLVADVKTMARILLQQEDLEGQDVFRL